jgi:O-antigen ligase
MYTIGHRRFLQNFLAPIAISSVTGWGLVALTFHFGYATTFWLVCGLPVGVFVLSALLPTLSKLKSLTLQLRWWHFAWFLIFLSGLVFRIRDVETIEAHLLDFWALYRIVLAGIVVVMLLGRLVIRHTPWIRSLVRGLIGLLSAYVLVCILSTLWSVYPLWTLYRSAEYLVGVCLIAVIIVSIKTVQEFKTLFDWTWVLTGFLTITVWLGIVIWPEQAVSHGVGLIGIQIQGVLPAVASNGVGDLGAFLGIITLSRLLFPTKHRRVYWIAFLISMLTLVLSQSRTPLMGFLLALPLVLFACRRIGILVLSAILILALLYQSIAGDLFWQFFLRGQTHEEFASLSGRVGWWEAGWPLFKERPLTGHGAYAAARFIVLAGLGATRTGSLHNTWIEVLVNTGIVGLSILFLCILGIWIVLLRFLPQTANDLLVHRLQVEAIGVLAVLSFRSFFTAGFIWHSDLAFLLVLGYAEFLRRYYNGLRSWHRPLPSASVRRKSSLWL